MAAPPMDAWRKRYVRRVLAGTLAFELPLFALIAARAVLVHGLALGLAVATSAVAMIVLNLPLYFRLREWRDHERRSMARVWLVELPYFAFFAGAVFFALVLIPALIAAIVIDGPGRAMLRTLSLAAMGSMGVGLYSVFVRRLWTPVAEVEIEVDALDPALDGLVIAQLSDVHCGPYLPRWFLRRLARRTSSVGADLIVVTGDSITEGEGYLDELEAFVRGLRAPRGVYACLGNHDYFSTIDGARLALERGGAKVLRNDGVLVARAEHGPTFFLAGVDDNWTGRDDVTAAMRDRPASGACVLLAHDPSLFDRYAARKDIDVVLSGHTHAGQVSVPFVTHRYNLGQLKFRPSVGLSRSADGRTALFIHPGNGTSAAPVRFGVAPVIARITLRRARSSR